MARITHKALKQAIEEIVKVAEEDLRSPSEYARSMARGRILGLELLCIKLGFKELEDKFQKMREER